MATAARPASHDKVRAHRARLRKQGLRPVQMWVPDVRSRAFARATSVLLLLLATRALLAQDVTLAVVLERLHHYLDDYAKLLPATIAVERYQQNFGSFERVLLESEFGIVRVPNHPQWLGFRDVVKVNGKVLAGRDRRLGALFENPTVSAIEQARRIALESARFNVGPVRRTINDPALVLELLDSRNAHRMKFQKDRQDTLNNIPVWIVRFAETVRPTIVRTSSGQDEPSSGRAWIDPSTGRLLRAQATIDSLPSRRRVICNVDVTFQKKPQLDFWVPATMRESCFDGASRQQGEATYDNYRKFTVETRESLDSTP
jgi:antidote-toxin recognition MazE-like antitoxin